MCEKTKKKHTQSLKHQKNPMFFFREKKRRQHEKNRRTLSKFLGEREQVHGPRGPLPFFASWWRRPIPWPFFQGCAKGFGCVAASDRTTWRMDSRS